MIKYFTDGDLPRIGIDTDKWRDDMLPLLKHGDYFYKFEGSATVSIEQLSKKMVMPMLLYTLIDMYELLKDAMPNEYITKDLLAISKNEVGKDEYDTLMLTYDHAKFIDTYEKEVKAWLPLIVKRYVQPNHMRIKDFLSGNI